MSILLSFLFQVRKNRWEKPTWSAFFMALLHKLNLITAVYFAIIIISPLLTIVTSYRYLEPSLSNTLYCSVWEFYIIPSNPKTAVQGIIIVCFSSLRNFSLGHFFFFFYKVLFFSKLLRVPQELTPAYFLLHLWGPLKSFFFFFSSCQESYL